MDHMVAATTDFSKILGHPCEVIRARFGATRFDRYFHATFSVGLVTSGVNAFSYRRRRVEVPAGSICIADPGEVHDGGLAGAAWSYTNIFVPAVLLGALSREDDARAAPAFAEGIVTDRTTCRFMAGLFRALAAGQAKGEAIDELAVLAFGRLLRRHAVERAPGTAREIRPLARRAMEIMNDSGGKSVSLADLARHTGASRYGVIRAVSLAIGLTPVAYMIQLRVEQAKTMIRAGMPLAEVALESGFADQSHLTRAMKRRWGITPSRLKPTR
jgi:AraC-like DNA-binding protein